MLLWPDMGKYIANLCFARLIVQKEIGMFAIKYARLMGVPKKQLMGPFWENPSRVEHTDWQVM